MQMDDYNEVRDSTLLFISGNCLQRKTHLNKSAVYTLYETAPEW